jgi:hypothetical protein
MSNIPIAIGRFSALSAKDPGGNDFYYNNPSFWLQYFGPRVGFLLCQMGQARFRG